MKPFITRFRSFAAAGMLLVSGTLALPEVPPAGELKAVPAKAEAVQPILAGQTFPAATLTGIDGISVNLNALLAEKPAVLIYYRGGWCSYCNEQLAQLNSVAGEFDKLGFQLIAVSPDRPEQLQKTVAKHQLVFRLLSDSDMNTSRKLGIAFRLDDATFKKYKNDYKVDIEAASGQTHHQLPAPSAFVVDRNGLIHLAYVNPDYKLRIDPDVLLSASKALLRHNATLKKPSK